MIDTAIILAGGFGTRLQTVVTDLPKPMAPINGQPFLNYQLRYLKHYGIKNIVLSTGYLAEKIKAHYGAEFEGLQIGYAHEHTPLGTGGGIRHALRNCERACVLVLNGDSFFDLDLALFFSRHRDSRAEFSIALRYVDDAARYGTIRTDSQNTVISFIEKNNEHRPGLINAGVYLVERDTLINHSPPDPNFSIEKDFFEKQLDNFSIKGFEFEGYFIDIGIPQDYHQAEHDFKRFKY